MLICVRRSYQRKLHWNVSQVKTYNITVAKRISERRIRQICFTKQLITKLNFFFTFLFINIFYLLIIGAVLINLKGLNVIIF